jgi:hypothetical protein
MCVCVCVHFFNSMQLVLVLGVYLVHLKRLLGNFSLLIRF